MSRTRRLQVFTESESRELFEPPVFSNEEREYYFSLSPMEIENVNSLRTEESKVFFIVMLGYFKAKRRFFSDSQMSSPEDLCYISKRYFSGKIYDLFEVTSTTRNRYQKSILRLLGYRTADNKIKNKLKQRSLSLAKISIDPVYIVRGLIRFLMDNKIVIPVKSYLQDVVGAAVNSEQRRVEDAIDRKLTKNVKKQIDELIDSEDENGIHLLTGLKKDPKDFSYSQIQGEIKRKALLEKIFSIADKALKGSGLSNETIKHFALLVDFYTAYKIKMMQRLTARLYTVCFIVTRYRKINDNLVTSFIYLVDNYWKEAKQGAKDEVYDLKIEVNENLPLVGRVLEMLDDDSIDNSIELGKFRRKASRVISKPKRANTVKFLKDGLFDEQAIQWNHIGNLGSKITRNLRPIFNAIAFSANNHPKDCVPHILIEFRKLLERGPKSLRNEIKTLLSPLVPKNMRKNVFSQNEDTDNPANKMKAQNHMVSKAEFFLYNSSYQFCDPQISAPGIDPPLLA